VLEIPALRQILAVPQVTLPVAGVAYNVNASLGYDEISRCGDKPNQPVQQRWTRCRARHPGW
jgi:hypothetical protein